MAQPTLQELKGQPDLEEIITKVAAMYNPGLRLAGGYPLHRAVGVGGHPVRRRADPALRAVRVSGDPHARRTVDVPKAYSHGQQLPVYALLEQAGFDYEVVLDEPVAHKVMP